MKKTLSLLLAITFLLGLLAGCGKKNNTGSAETADPTAIGSGAVINGWEDLNLFNKDLIAVADATGKWGYANIKGEWIIPGQYDKNRAFANNGLGAVCVGEKWGFIDTQGKFVVNLMYDYVSDYGINGLAVVCQNGKYGAIDAQGKTVISPQFDYMSDFDRNGLAKIGYNSGTNDWGENQRKYGYVNQQGVIVVAAAYDHLGSFAKNGLAVCCVTAQDGNGNAVTKYGYIDMQGKNVITPQYAYAQSFADNDLAVVQLSGSYDEDGHYTAGKYGFIDEKGNLKVAAQFDEAQSFHNGMAAVAVYDADGYSWGYINSSGDVAVQPQYDAARGFADNGLAAVQMSGQWGYIDKSGNVKLSLQFDSAYSFDENGYAIVAKANGGYSYLYGVINDKGETILATVYENVTTAGDLFIFERDGKCGVADSSGKEVVVAMYDGIFGFFKDGYAVVSMGDYYGVINKQGDMIVNPQYSEIGEPWIDVTRLENY